MSRKCLLCNKDLLPGNANEHIIPNSIGGRLKSPLVICTACNEEKGKGSDKRFADFFNPLCIHFHITRDRDESPDSIITLSDGKQICKSVDGTLSLKRPDYKEIDAGNGKTRIIAEAQNKKILRQLLGRVKNSKINPDIAVEQADSTPEQLNEFVSFALIPPKAGFDETIITACLALASFHGVDLSYSTEAIDFLNGKNQKSFCGLFYDRDLIHERPQDKVFHCIGISSNNSAGMLIGYFEIFNCFRYLVKLADNYSGDPVNIVYSIDPVSGVEIEINLCLDVSMSEMEQCLRKMKNHTEDLCNAAKSLFSIKMPNLSQNEYLSAIVNTAARKAKAECGFLDPDALVSENDWDRYKNVLSREIADMLTEHCIREWMRRERAGERPSSSE